MVTIGTALDFSLPWAICLNYSKLLLFIKCTLRLEVHCINLWKMT